MRVKKIIFWAVLAIMLCVTTGIHTEAASRKQQAFQAYGKYLEEHPSSVEKFSVGYINNDKVPELICRKGYQTYFYTFQKGKIIYVGKVDSTAGETKFYPKKKLIVQQYVWGGMMATNQYTYYHYSNYKLQVCLYKEGYSIMEKNGYSAWKYTYTNYNKGKRTGTMSESAAKRKLKKLVGSTRPKTVVFHENSAVSRKKYLK